MTWTNAQLRRRLRDALADQRGSLYKKLAAGLPVTSAYEKALLKTALGDTRNLTVQLNTGIGEAEISERQHIALSNAANTGQFKLNYGTPTGFLNYNDSAATIQTALRLLSGLSAVVVSGSLAGGLDVSFAGVAGNASLLTVSNNTVAIAAVAATATLDLTADIVLTASVAGTGRNTNTFTLQIAPAAANPTNTVLAAFTGTSAAIILTITPNNGTNNSATPVNLTTAQVRELITTGAVSGKSVTVTDGSSLRALQTATGGGATNVADGGEGDGVVATYAGGAAAQSTTITVTETTPGATAAVSTAQKADLKAGLSDQGGSLTAALAAGTDFSA